MPLNLVMLSFFLVASVYTNAQSYKSLQFSEKPLQLKAQGSFYIGGESVSQSSDEQGSFGPGGHITIKQMYVKFMVPEEQNKTSVVLIHGMSLTGKCWETTPDGKMGWDEYFVRKGYPVFVPDQVERGRSGFNQAVFNNVRTGKTGANQLPSLRRFSDEVVWPNFRIGYETDKPFPHGLFPVEALSELAKQCVPDIASAPLVIAQNYSHLAELSAELENTILISHSQSGAFPLETALVNPTGIKAMVLLEPGHIRSDYTDEQIIELAKIPVLIVFGDYLAEVPTGIRNFSWQNSYDSGLAYINRIKAAGGNASMWFLPEMGIRGNSHMLMHDKNYLEIADRIINWFKENTEN